jgi:tRNA-splicing endonuclease subunit Sen34
LIGNLPDYGEQVAFNAPPLLLSIDEVAFIRSRNICPILDDSLAYQWPNTELVGQFEAARENWIESHAVEYERIRREKAEKYRIPKERSEKTTADAPEKSHEEKKTHIAAFEPTILIPLQTPSELSMGRENNLVEVVDLQYPKTAMEQLRCRVFADLWDKGLFVQPDSRFKCDYLVYEGARAPKRTLTDENISSFFPLILEDPMIAHAAYVVICCLWNQSIDLLEVSGRGRLATTIRKHVVVASLNPDDDKIVYTTLQFEGVS